MQNTYKVVVVGDACVGKTTLVSQLVNKPFHTIYNPTIGVEFEAKDVRISPQHEQVRLQIWDTSGQECFLSITSSFFHCAKAVVIVYDVTNRITFRNITNWITLLQKSTNFPQMKIMIVANKGHLNNARQISTQEGMIFASRNGFMFMEIAQLSQIENVFKELTRSLINVGEEKAIKRKRFCCFY